MSEIKKLLEKLEEVQKDLKDLKQSNEILKEEVELFAITEMANRQGTDEYFEYYTLDSEYESHNPHIHICVKNNDKHWKGKPLRSGNPFKSIASVLLYPQKIEYNKDNIVFEDVVDSNIDTSKYKKIIAKWLNTIRRGEENYIKCIDDYLTNNLKFFNREKYVEFLKSLE